MSSGRPPVPQRVPTLTEVVEIARGAPAAVVTTDAPAPMSAAAALPGHESVATGRSVVAASEEELIERVLADLQRQVELMLEYRMREVLAPALARVADALVRDVRAEMASTLRDMVARAVAQEIVRHRGR